MNRYVSKKNSELANESMVATPELLSKVINLNQGHINVIATALLKKMPGDFPQSLSDINVFWKEIYKCAMDDSCRYKTYPVFSEIAKRKPKWNGILNFQIRTLREAQKKLRVIDIDAHNKIMPNKKGMLILGEEGQNIGVELLAALHDRGVPEYQVVYKWLDLQISKDDKEMLTDPAKSWVKHLEEIRKLIDMAEERDFDIGIIAELESQLVGMKQLAEDYSMSNVLRTTLCEELIALLEIILRLTSSPEPVYLVSQEILTLLKKDIDIEIDKNRQDEWTNDLRNRVLGIEPLIVELYSIDDEMKKAVEEKQYELINNLSATATLKKAETVENKGNIVSLLSEIRYKNNEEIDTLFIPTGLLNRDDESCNRNNNEAINGELKHEPKIMQLSDNNDDCTSNTIDEEILQEETFSEGEVLVELPSDFPHLKEKAEIDKGERPPVLRNVDGEIDSVGNVSFQESESIDEAVAVKNVHDDLTQFREGGKSNEIPIDSIRNDLFEALKDARWPDAYWLSWVIKKKGDKSWDHVSFSAFLTGMHTRPGEVIGGELRAFWEGFQIDNNCNIIIRKLLAIGSLALPLIEWVSYRILDER